MLAGKCPGRPPGRLASLQNAHWLYIVVSPVYNLNRGRRLSGNTGRGKNCEELSCLKIEIATYASRRGVVFQWLGDGEWTGHNQVEGPPTLSGPVDSYASPEHRQQQAQARRAAAARVAAQREDSSDLAPEHPTRITPRNRSSTGSLRSAPRTSTGSGDHLARFETGDY